MSNIMSNFKLSNKPSRNGFDLTTRNSFTAKIGELLPVLCEECLPGDKFKINLSHFARTQPLTSPAYIRIKEYYDFVFVPTRLLWRYFDQFVNQMPNNVSSDSSTTEIVNLSRHPYFTRNSIYDCLTGLSTAGVKDDLGYDIKSTSLKLLEYLNYGNISTSPSAPQVLNNALNPFPLLAYQKAYCDLYRFDQWENPEPHSFNLDWLFNNTNMEINLSDIVSDTISHNYFTLRYANYPKDLFMGVLPNSQFGDVSLVSTTSGLSNLVTQLTAVTSGRGLSVRANGTVGPYSEPDGTPLSSKDSIDSFFNFSILALRQAEFLQKWKEVSQTAKQDYRDQIKAHWGVSVSNARSNICEYLGGTSANVQISGETNANLVDGTTMIKGTALSAAKGMIDYDVPEHGYIMCIYHASPILDYRGDFMVSPVNFKTMPTDYAIPEMDKTGMQLLPLSWLYGNYKPVDGDNFAGYVPRYIDYKTDVDKTHGAFNQSYSYWVAPFSLARLTGQTTYKLFKIDSSIFNSVFGVNVDSTVDTDQLLCNASFDIKAVRNLDVNGMPY